MDMAEQALRKRSAAEGARGHGAKKAVRLPQLSPGAMTSSFFALPTNADGLDLEEACAEKHPEDRHWPQVVYACI